MSWLAQHQNRTLLVMGLLVAVINLDFYGLAILLPAVGKDFQTGGSELEWVMNSYLLTYSAPLIALGRVGDVIGPKKLAIGGAVLFVLAGAGSFLANDVWVLVATRMVQGLAAAMICVVAVAMISRAHEGAGHTSAIGYMSAIYMMGGMVGPFLAGALTDALSWRWFFGLGVVLMLACLFLLLAFVTEEATKPANTTIDWAGFAVLTGALFLVVIALELVQRLGWTSSWTLLCLGGGLGGCALFYWVERRQVSPLVDFSLFVNRRFACTCVLFFLTFFPFGAMLYFLALYLQHVLGYSAIQSGAIYLAMMIPIVVISLVSGRLTERCGLPFALAFSCAAMVVAFVLFGFVQGESPLFLILSGLLVLGIGQGLVSAVGFSIGMAAVPAEKSGEGSGILGTVRNMALPLGVAASGAFFRTWENDQLAHLLNLAGGRVSKEMQVEIYGLLSGSQAIRERLDELSPDLAARVHLVVDQAFSHAFRNLMFLCIALSAVALLLTYLFKDQGTFDEKGTESAGGSKPNG